MVSLQAPADQLLRRCGISRRARWRASCTRAMGERVSILPRSSKKFPLNFGEILCRVSSERNAQKLHAASAIYRKLWQCHLSPSILMSCADRLVGEGSHRLRKADGQRKVISCARSSSVTASGKARRLRPRHEGGLMRRGIRHESAGHVEVGRRRHGAGAALSRLSACIARAAATTTLKKRRRFGARYCIEYAVQSFIA